MAPEQARGGGIDARADLFALGVMTYELLSGQRPWAGKNDLDVLVAVSSTDPVDITEHRKVSQVFVDITRRCLKKRPADRYASASEIKAALDGWRRERGFDRDDAASLAAFVRRNTPEQQKWFKEALGGALAQGGVTFSDLEDKIDRGRKGESAQDSRPRTVSGVMRAAEQAAIDRAAEPRPAPPAAPPPASGKLEEIDDNARTQYMPQGGSALGHGGRGAVPIPAPTPRLGAQPGYAPKLASTVALSPEEADSRLAASRPASHLGAMSPQSSGASTILAEPIPASQIPASHVTGAGNPASQPQLAWGVPQAPLAGAAALGPTSLGPLSQARMSAMPIASTPPMGGPASSPFSAPYSAPISSGPVSPQLAAAPASAPMARTAPNRLAATVNDDGRRRSSGGRLWLYVLVVVIFCAAGGTIAWLLTHGLPTK
jgi:serine/threonine-protein kinase